MTPQQYFEHVPQTVDMTIRSELFHTNEFNFAVAVILSAQATDKKVNEVTPKLFSVAPTPQKMLELGIDGLKEYIRVISFFNNKAKNIIALSQKLVDENISQTRCIRNIRLIKFAVKQQNFLRFRLKFT